MRLLILAVILALTLSARAVLAKDLDEHAGDAAWRDAAGIGECHETTPEDREQFKTLLLKKPEPRQILRLTLSKKGKPGLRGVLLESAGPAITYPTYPATVEYPGAERKWAGRFSAASTSSTPCKIALKGKGGPQLELEREPNVEGDGFVKDFSGTQVYSGTMALPEGKKTVTVECRLNESALSEVVSCAAPVEAEKREDNPDVKRVEEKREPITLDPIIIKSRIPGKKKTVK